MNRSELLEVMRNGEDSGVEFETDGIGKEKLAEDMVSFANFRGGVVLLGVEDDGTVSGLTREEDEVSQWVTNACRDKIRPEILPYITFHRKVGGANTVAEIAVMGSTEVHAVWHNQKESFLIRAGSQNNVASRQELGRLFQRRTENRFEKQPVPNTGLNDLDLRRLKDYFGNIRGQSVPETNVEWRRLLRNTEIMAGKNATAGGLVLFGNDPFRSFPQSAINAAAFPGKEKDCDYHDRASMRGAMVPYHSGNKLQEDGLVEQALLFVRRNTGVSAKIVGGRRVAKPKYPEKVLREALVNALVHRNYLMGYTTIELYVYSDRLEIISPGSLSNGVTPDNIRMGRRSPTNPMMMYVMRDYGYVDTMGMGVPKIIIKGMLEHNGTEPEFIEQNERFTVRLFSGKKARKRKTPPRKRAG